MTIQTRGRSIQLASLFALMSKIRTERAPPSISSAGVRVLRMYVPRPLSSPTTDPHEQLGRFLPSQKQQTRRKQAGYNPAPALLRAFHSFTQSFARLIDPTGRV